VPAGRCTCSGPTSGTPELVLARARRHDIPSFVGVGVAAMFVDLLEAHDPDEYTCRR